MADDLLATIFGHQDCAAELVGDEWETEASLETQEQAEGGSQGEAALDMEAPPEEVVRRIESASLWFVSRLCEGQLPDIDLVQRQASSRVLTASQGGSGEPGSDEGGTGPLVLRMQRRSLLGRHPESAEAVARLFVLLEAVHDLLLAGQQATQREVWYQFKTLEIFRSPRDVSEAIQDAVCMLQVPRSALGITASSKGLVAGRLRVLDQRAGTETDCAALGGTGMQIPGDIAHITRDYAFETDAQVVLVIEKDAIFQRLVQQRFFDAVPCILVTGKGVPDLATRAFVSHLSASFPELPLAGLVDWNPAGAGILCIYRFGSPRMGLESPHYALPTLGWLGARSRQLRHADVGAFQDMTSRDQAMATNLVASLRNASPAWADELRQMLSSDSKAEIEALDTAVGGSDLAGLLASCLQQGDCI